VRIMFQVAQERMPLMSQRVEGEVCGDCSSISNCFQLSKCISTWTWSNTKRTRRSVSLERNRSTASGCVHYSRKQL